MNLTRHAVTLLVALIASTVTPRLYAQVRIAVVDLQRAMNETEDGRAANRRVEFFFFVPVGTPLKAKFASPIVIDGE